MMIKFYTSHCPICRVLKMTMDNNNIEYEEFDDINLYMSIAEDNGIKSMPFADIDGKILNTSELRDYIKERTK